MAPPTYNHRHLLLTALLERQEPPPPDCFSVGGQDNERGCKLDALLLRGWSLSVRKTKPQDNDILHNVDSLRLKKNDFEVLGRVGEGQFGVVDAVRCKLNGKVYALKSVEKHMAIRAGGQLGLPFERHVHMMATETSPAPALLTSFQSPNALHLVTEYAACGSIWDRLCEMPPVPGLDTGRMKDGEVRWWARQMVDAIAWIHGVGYAHRDIKPHNFLLLADGRLWLTDFGSAAPLEKGKVARRHCMLPVGTPDYIAPEVLRISEDAMVEAAQTADEDDDGDRTIRHSDLTALGYGADIDWWSLGATLYEMAVGRAPFWAPTIGPTYERIMRCDLRLPEDLSPRFRSLLSSLLCMNDVRLGATDASEIRRHSYFTDVDWSKKVGHPPPGVALQPIDLGTLAESFVHDYNDFTEATFDHFFNSPGLTTAMTSSVSMSMSMAVPESAWSRWVGWSWSPPAEHFGPEQPIITVSPASRVSGPGPGPGPRQSSAPPTTHMLTPLRNGLHASPLTVPRTAPRSVPRTRPASERQAFAELLRCVEASAKKKLASTRPVPGSASTVSSVTSPTVWRKEQPPTPTPMSRESTTLSATFVSKAGVAVPRPLSRTSSRTDLPSRPSSRTSGHSRQGSTASRGSQENSGFGLGPPSRNGSWRTRDDTFLAKLAAVEVERPSLRSTPSLESIGASHSVRQGSLSPIEPTTKVLTRRGLSSIQEGRKPNEFDSPEPPRRLHSVAKYGALGASPPVRPRAPLSPVAPIIAYVPPRHPGKVGDASSLASLEVWHKSLENGLDNLERRLADLTTRNCAP